MPLDLSALEARLVEAQTVHTAGRVRAVVGLAIRAAVPGARLGELVEIVRRDLPALPAEVVGFELDDVILVPLGAADGIGPDDPVRASGSVHEIVVGPALLGRVLDGLGQPIDGGPRLVGERFAVMRDPPNPMTRARITRPMSLGVRTLDGLLTTGEGQRVGLFAGSGVGKSTLLGQIARQAEADVFVACLIGERGREVREFLEDSLGESGRARGVVVCATSDAPAMVRKKSAYVATAIAEHFRDQGKRVILLLDSVTRFARAGREVGLSAGEPPARRGYPPSVFAELPRLLERSGNAERGSITAFYTVLVEGGDMEEPIADEVRGILDGHVVLDRALAARGRFPAIDPLVSLSRVMDGIVTPQHRDAAARLRAALALYESKRDLVTLGAYKKGSDPKLDQVLARIDVIEGFLKQRRDERVALADTAIQLAKLV
ncbi:MAG: FliI/YscN family ATPase [Sandaracinaceae bacterium]|nr:FliI/YscN family ATPase [Sandaracinaceae bacterium]